MAKAVQKKGIIWNTLGSSMYAANSFIMLVLVSQTSDVATVGSFGFALTIAQQLYLVGVFGASSYHMTDYNNRFSFSSYSRFKVFSTIVAAAACVVIILFSPGDALRNYYLILLAGFFLLNSAAELYQNLFFQHNRLDLSGKSLFFRSFISTLGFSIVIVITKRADLALLVLIFLNVLCTWFWGTRLTGQFVHASKDFSLAQFKILLREFSPLFLSAFLMLYITNCSKYSINWLLNDEVQGYYNMIFVPAQMINLVSQFIFRPLLNEFAKILYSGRPHEFRKKLFRLIILVAILTIICAVAIFFLGPAVLGWFYGTDLSLLRVEMLLIVIGGGIFAVCQLVYYLLVILRKQKAILITYILGSVFATLISLVFVLAAGITGACIAFILAHLLLLIIYVLFLAKALRQTTIDKGGAFMQ